eukprot:SAG31_NODE_1699_length_7499_cov_5.315135_9_plen_81_part_00
MKLEDVESGNGLRPRRRPNDGDIHTGIAPLVQLRKACFKYKCSMDHGQRLVGRRFGCICLGQNFLLNLVFLNLVFLKQSA